MCPARSPGIPVVADGAHVLRLGRQNRRRREFVRTRSLLGGTAVEVTTKPVGTLGADKSRPWPCASY